MNELYFVIRALIEGMVGSEYNIQVDDHDSVKVKITGHSQERGASVSRLEIKGKPCLTMVTNPDGTTIIDVDWPSEEAPLKIVARVWDHLTKPKAQL